MQGRERERKEEKEGADGRKAKVYWLPAGRAGQRGRGGGRERSSHIPSSPLPDQLPLQDWPLFLALAPYPGSLSLSAPPSLDGATAARSSKTASSAGDTSDWNYTGAKLTKPLRGQDKKTRFTSQSRVSPPFSHPVQTYGAFEFRKLPDESVRVQNRGKRDHPGTRGRNHSPLSELPDPLSRA